MNSFCEGLAKAYDKQERGPNREFRLIEQEMPIPLIPPNSARVLALILAATAAVIPHDHLTAMPQEESTSAHKPAIQKRVGELLYDPPHPAPVSYQDDELSLRLDFSQSRLSVIVQKKGEPQHEISLPNEMAQVDEILRAPTNRALVLGWASGDVSAIAVLDLKAAILSDFFYAYLPTVSPNGRYIAYVKFYPPHGYDDPSGPEAHYMLYDLTQTASQNRPAGVAASRPDVVGTTVYPPNIGNRFGDNMRISQGEEHSSAMQTFFWSPDSDRFVFADKYQGALKLVLARVNGRGGRSGEATVEIPQDELCAKTYMRACDLQLDTAEFVTEPLGGVTVSFFAVGMDRSRKTKSLQFLDQQFKPAN